MIKPTIHMNGDSAETLTEGYLKAHRSLHQAMEDLALTNPNARNYYPQGDAAFSAARDEHNARLKTLEAVLHEIFELTMYCGDQRKERAA